MAGDPRKVGRLVVVRSTAATTGSTTIGSGANGTVTVTADVAGRITYFITVVLGVGISVAMTAVAATASGGWTTITVTLGTDIAGALDATKNTATLVAAAVNALANVGATASGTGATALTLAEGPKVLGGRDRRLRRVRITAVGAGTNIDGTDEGGIAYTNIPRWSRSSPATTGWERE